VSIPIKIYSTSRRGESISFRMLHGKCKTRLKQQYICPKDGEIVPRSDMVKGYEFAKDQYVVFSDDEIAASQVEVANALQISEFVPLDKVDPVYFDKPYYLGPDKGGERAYLLLSEALKQTGLCAVAQYTARGKQYLVLLRPIETGIVMQQLRYPREVKSFDEVPVGEPGELNEAELSLALLLIEQSASEDFDMDKYVDHAHEGLSAAVDQKVAGEEIEVASTEGVKTQVIDLMAALKLSLTGGDGSGASEAEQKPAKRAHPSEAEAKEASS
jgi:DNA end-binding protein Ku